MKKLFALICVLTCLVLAGPAWGAYEYTEKTFHLTGNFFVLEYQWSTDAAGNYTSTATTANVNGMVYQIETDPAPYATMSMIGATFATATVSTAAYSPTDDYDITIKNSAGYDLAGGALANRDEADTEFIEPLKDSGNYGGVGTYGPITIAITNAARESKGVIRIYVLGSVQSNR